MSTKPIAGFSVLELMIVLALLGVLVSTVAPNMTHMMIQFEGRMMTHRLLRAIQSARLLSVSRHHSMALCARDHGHDWSLGWQVVDGVTDQVYQLDSKLPPHWQLVWRGGLQSKTCLKFNSQGFVQGHQGRFVMTRANDTFSQKIVVGRSGYVRLVDG